MEDVIDIKRDITVLKERLRYSVRKANKVLISKYSYFFRFLDFLVVIIVLMNSGALVITNILLSEQRYEIGEVEYFEANEPRAEITGLKSVNDIGLTGDELIQKKQDTYNALKGLVFFAGYWAILITLYVVVRMRVHTHTQMYILLFVICFYFSLLSLYFFNYKIRIIWLTQAIGYPKGNNRGVKISQCN